MYEIDKGKLQTIEDIAEFIKHLVGTVSDGQINQMSSKLAEYFKAVEANGGNA